MIDSDKLFEKHLKKWLDEHKGEYTADETEEMIPELYEKWVTTPSAETDGVTPEEYFARVTDPGVLVDEFVRTNRGDGNPCSLLLDRIAEVPECAPGLIKIIEENADPKTVIAAMDVLDESGAEQPLGYYAGLIVDENADEGVVEKAAEILKENAGAVRDALRARRGAGKADNRRYFSGNRPRRQDVRAHERAVCGKGKRAVYRRASR